MHHSPIACFLLVLLCGPLASQTPLYTIHGTNLSDLLGMSVAGAGDVDRDGFPDLIVGAPQLGGSAGSFPGYALVISGRAGTVIHRLDERALGNRFGAAVAAAGDTDGDGYLDVIVGAPMPRPGLGFARILSGQDGRVLHTLQRISGPGSSVFGDCVAGIGDVDGDGRADVAVTERDPQSSSTDAIHVYSGGSGALIRSLPIAAGNSVVASAIGDVDGDRVPDLLAGSGGYSNGLGKVEIYSGSTWSVIRSVSGPAPAGYFGRSVTGVGDLSGDGVPDFAVAPAPYVHAPAVAMVYSGSDASLLFPLCTEGFGWAVAGGGDVDGDGFPDVLVDASDASSSQALHVFSGCRGERLFTIRRSLSAMAIPGDLNGDGFADIAVGEAYSGSLGEGEASVYPGTHLPILQAVSAERVRFQGGESVTLNGDGFTPWTTVEFGTVPATAVQYVDRQTLHASTPQLATGLQDISVVQQSRRSTLREVLKVTPFHEVVGTPAAGGTATLRFLGTSGDALFAVAGITPLSPPVAIPGFAGALAVLPEMAILPGMRFYTDSMEFVLFLPFDPLLRGSRVITQGIAGPHWTPGQTSFTNAVPWTIQ